MLLDPHTQEGKKIVEAVQHKSARFTHTRYHINSYVTKKLDKLKWEHLTLRRTRDCLTLFYTSANSVIAIDTEGYLILANSHTRAGHKQKCMFL